MKKNEWFPLMLEPPPGPRAAAATVAWGFFMLGIPSVTKLVLIFTGDVFAVRQGIEIAGSIVFALMMVLIYRDYLADSFMNVQMDPKKFITTVAIACALMIAAAVVLTIVVGEEVLMVIPIKEFILWEWEATLVTSSPVISILVLAVCAPVAISCMYYTVGFSLMCANSSKWAYVIVSAVLFAPYLFRVTFHGVMDFEWQTYLMRLPLYLVACWAYQRTDSIWAPIVCHAVTNLLFCLFHLWNQTAGFFF